MRFASSELHLILLRSRRRLRKLFDQLSRGRQTRGGILINVELDWLADQRRQSFFRRGADVAVLVTETIGQKYRIAPCLLHVDPNRMRRQEAVDTRSLLGRKIAAI